MLLSICIPTYNRVLHLDNCLNSIFLAKKRKNLKFEVCVSDNGSSQNTGKIINKYKKKLNIKFHKFKKNKGFALNLLKAIRMASGEYVWMLGNDDLLNPNAFKEINKVLNKKKKFDFVYINSSYLNKEYLDTFKHPFDTKNLPKKMKKISNEKKSRELNFWQLVDPKVSWDFMLGIFLLMFNRKMFLNNLDILNLKNMSDKRPWSNSDNTFWYLKVCARSFKNSKAFFCAKPLSINLYGVREWHNLYYLIEIVRMPEVLDYFREEGMGFLRYVYCKNFALRNYFNYMLKIILMKKKGGLEYVSFFKHFLLNLVFPNLYLSIVYYFLRKFKRSISI
tara:strand:+ start:12772 stop:13776 length:1005 start_codon:yes stop_codon:yes gene_type:complete